MERTYMAIVWVQKVNDPFVTIETMSPCIISFYTLWYSIINKSCMEYD